MGVSFTLRGLNTQLSLIRKAGYPIHVAQDICGSYYLNLDMSASLFDNIFWFKSTNPDLKDDVVIPSYSNYNFSVYNGSTLQSSTITITNALESYSLNTNKFQHYKIIIKNHTDSGGSHKWCSTGFFRFYNSVAATPDDNIFPLYAVSSHTSYGLITNNSFLSIDPTNSLIGKYGPAYDPTMTDGRGGVGPGDNEAFIYFSFSKPIEIKKMLFQPIVVNSHKFIIENMELYGTNDPLGNYSNFADDVTTYVGNSEGSNSYMDLTSDFYTTENTITWTLVNNITNVSSVFTLGNDWTQSVVPVHFEKLKDVAYYVDSSNWPDISYSHGLITNPDAGVPGAKADIDTYFVDRYLRFIGPAWLAKNITGGYNNSDLFENEDALQRQFVNFNGNFYRYIRFVVTSLVDANINDANASAYTTTVSEGNKRGFTGFEDFKFYENNTQIQVSDISDITYSSIYKTAAYRQGSLYESSFNNLLDDSSGTFWISKERKDNGNLLYEASDPLLLDLSYNDGFYSRKYLGPQETTYNLQLKDNDNNPQTRSISGEWLQFEFKNNISLSKIDFRPVGDHTPGVNIDGTEINFVGTIPGSMAVLTSMDGTNWDVQNEYNNLDISPGVNEFTDNADYRSLYNPNIKREITKVLDDSGGSASNPLTNADTDFNNISRDILKNMLDSDDPATVQRVHTMIENAHMYSSNSGVETSDINPWIPIEFKDGDKMEFSLVYGTSNITDASNVALNSSGNRLGSNVVEDQGYYVRIHMK